MNESKTISPPRVYQNPRELNSSQEKKIVGSAQTKKEQKRELVILRGITTSQINQAPKGSKTHGKNPYPARVFLKVEDYEWDIPVFFRLIDTVNWKEKKWEKPKIKTGSLIEIRGYFDNPINGSSRKSFTAYSYQLLNKEQAKIETHVK